MDLQGLLNWSRDYNLIKGLCKIEECTLNIGGKYTDKGHVIGQEI